VKPSSTLKTLKEFKLEMSLNMTSEEIEQFLACARVGRLGIIVDDKPYVVPVGFGYCNDEVFFHTCEKGLKMNTLKKNPSVCFEVDEALSDVTMYKSVIILGTTKIISEEKKMIPYLQKLIDKYRVPLMFDEYMSKPGRNREKELKAVRICVITPRRITGRRFVQNKAPADTTVSHSAL
jgi:nitroimidazol reductase NimA-like FMN-containing flavoprotein (pyridoxamine 5'-phosphate oxidase superfamily)